METLNCTVRKLSAYFLRAHFVPRKASERFSISLVHAAERKSSERGIPYTYDGVGFAKRKSLSPPPIPVSS